MKRILLASSIIFLSLFTTKAQTNVSGGIYSNTTWTLANSPYIVTDTVVVFQGVTLTIQPGVVIKFDNGKWIEIRGNLNANGTAVDSIIFTSNSATPYAGIHSGLYFSAYPDTSSFKYCSFYFANNAIYNRGVDIKTISHCRFTSNLTGIYSNDSPVDTCIFRYDSIGISNSYSKPITGSIFNYNGTAIWQSDNTPISNCIIDKNNYGIRTSNQNTIEYCIIDSNRAAGIFTGSADSIFNCDLSYNGTGVSVGYSTIFLNTISNNTNDGILTTRNTVMCNSICNNTPYNAVAEYTYNETIKDNYWCLPDSAHIYPTIYDGRTHLSYGELFFTPFDTVACTNYCNMTVSVIATNTVVCASNSSATLSAVVSDGYSYTVNWKPGNFTGRRYTVSPTANTTYTLVVTDSHGCSDSTTITIDTMYCAPGCTLSAQAYVNNPFMATCSSDTLRVRIQDSSGIRSVIWQPGNFSGATYVVSPAATTNYTVTVTDSLGCTYTSSASIYVSGALSTPSICYVTADTASNHNLVVWSKVGIDTLAIDSILIYRELTYNNYVRIGAVSVHAYTEFMDLTSHPVSQSYFYEIAEKDTCNAVSLSGPAETILLQSTHGFGNQVNLSWNLYEGNTVDYYRIMRDDSGTGNWHVIDSVPGNVGAYIDVNAPSSPRLRYMLNTAWSLSCVPYLIMRPKKNTNANNSHARYRFNTTDESYSNITNIITNGVNEVLAQSDVDVYPNPASTQITITMHQPVDGTVNITDVLGQNVYTATLSSANGVTQKINISNLNQGVYFLKIESNGQVLTKKLMKL